uniref:RING-type domain-containing protein n=1 Tax=Neogobius melanostomus TaxID=47308 RepID=A0A8C6TFB8_9GOBI
MATAMCALSEQQFQCSICLDVFTDPVTTPCGHNFCKTCIEQHWANSVYNCPYCKEAFTRRPELKVNIFISEMAQQFRTAGPGEVGCDLCPEPRLKAVKSCLVCLSSYCELHLQPHLNTALKILLLWLWINKNLVSQHSHIL